MGKFWTTVCLCLAAICIGSTLRVLQLMNQDREDYLAGLDCIANNRTMNNNLDTLVPCPKEDKP